MVRTPTTTATATAEYHELQSTLTHRERPPEGRNQLDGACGHLVVVHLVRRVVVVVRAVHVVVVVAELGHILRVV